MGDPVPGPSGVKHTALIALLVCAGYFVGAELAFMLRIPSTRSSIIWAPNAVLLAVLLLTPPRTWAIWLLAALPAHLVAQSRDGGFVLVLLYPFFANVAQVIVAAMGLRCFAAAPPRFNTLRDMTLFVLIAVITAPALVSFLAAWVFVSVGWETNVWLVSRGRFLNNMTTGLTVAPLILMAAESGVAGLRRRRVQRYGEFALLAGGLVGTLYAIHIWTTPGAKSIPVQLYAPLPFLLWAAVRFGPGGLGLFLLVVAARSISETISGRGPYVAQTPAENVLALQMSLAVLATPLMFVAALIGERRKKGEALQESEERYRERTAELTAVNEALRKEIAERARSEQVLAETEDRLQRMADSIPEVIWITDLEPVERVVYASPSFERVWGLRLEDVYQNPRLWTETIHPEDRARVVSTFSQWIAGADVSYQDVEFRIVQPDGAIRWIHERGVLTVNAQGRPIRVSGISTDITDRKRVQDELQQAFAEIQTLKEQLQRENIALREEIDKASMFEEIVGTSPVLRAVLARVAKVAPTDSTVLITGETGTGKELIARAIHKRSPRASGAFVSVNCAAVPPALIASELFGHEKGAFTGAVQRRLGRFELAEGGTLFLDEIGELPSETQIALLRVLQEREFERVGGRQAIRADVRVIAAANRNLQAAIAAGTFRSDLFYRLNVFPIQMPPLRDRTEDIPMLVEYFVDRYSRKVGKKFWGANRKTLDLLQAYPWPGNVRELQNVIERSVIVCERETFSVDESWLSRDALPPAPRALTPSKTPAAQEKEIIEAALTETRGRVSGPSGAAAKLGLPPSTLESKIRSLKINKYRFKPV